MNYLTEKSAADKLDFLRKNHPHAHHNLMRVMDSAYAFYLCGAAEQAFVGGSTDGYTCYGVLVDYEDELADALNMQHIDNALYYIYTRVDFRYAVVYAISPENRIATRRHLYSEKVIKDVLTTCAHYLAQCNPGDIVCDIDLTTHVATILKGRVYYGIQF